MTVTPIVLGFVALIVVVGVVLIVTFSGNKKSTPLSVASASGALAPVINAGVGQMGGSGGAGSSAITPVNIASATQYYNSACGNGCPSEVPQCGNSLDVMDTAVQLLSAGANPCF